MVPWKHKSVGRVRVLSGRQLEKPSDVGGLCQHTRVVLYLLYTQPEVSFNYCIIAYRRAMCYEVCDTYSYITWPYQIVGIFLCNHCMHLSFCHILLNNQCLEEFTLLLKIYSHKTKILKVFNIFSCSTVYLSKHNIYAFLEDTSSFFSCFITPCTILLSCGIAHPCI